LQVLGFCTVLIDLKKGRHTVCPFFVHIRIATPKEITHILPSNMRQDTFMHRLWRDDRLLFWAITSFILAELFFTLIKLETTPFFLFGMYSQPQAAAASYPVYRISIDTQIVRSQAFYDSQREIIYNTISGYEDLKQHHFHDPMQDIIMRKMTPSLRPNHYTDLLNSATMDTPYQRWLLQYIADMRVIHNPIIRVTKQQVAYTPAGHLLILPTTDTLFTYRDE
jgi:hypothetical protein